MKKLLTASFLSLGLSISVMAADSTPVSTKGDATHPQYAGQSTCMIGASTATAAVLCASGSGIILQVIGSSVATTDYLTFRDTSIANTSSAMLTLIDKNSLNGVYVYPRFKKGLSVNASAAPGTTTSAWTIIYAKDLQ